MRLFVPFAFFCLLAVTLASTSTAFAEEVLLLHTASPHSPATKRLYVAAKATLQKDTPSLGLWQYWLEADKDDSEEHFDDVIEELEGQLAQHATVGIICDGPAAFALLQRYHGRLFQMLPAVFCLTDHSDAFMANYDRCPGLAVKSGLPTLFTTLLHIHPQLETLIVFTDHSPEGTALRQEAQVAFQDYLQRVQLILPGFEAGRAQGIDVEHSKAIAHNAPKKSAIILARTTRDKNGEKINQANLAEYMANSAEVPVYVLDEDSMSPHTAGSFAPSATEHGKQAATMLLHLMQGTPPAEAITALPREWTFQAHAMQRITTDFNQLPKQALMRGQLPRQPRRLPPGSAALAGLLLGAVLVFWFRRKK